MERCRLADWRGSRLMAGLRAGGVTLALLASALTAAAGNDPLRLAAGAAAPDRSPAVDGNVLDRFAHWLDRSVHGLGVGMKDTLAALDQMGRQTSDGLKNAAEEANGTLGSLPAVPAMRIVNKRQQCAVAANGGPDCRQAAVAICRANGFATGKTFETQTEQKCPLTVLLGRRDFKPGECRTETYVLRSLCE